MPDWLVLALKGLAIGVAVAAPVGAVGVLVIRRALAGRPWDGFVAGLGAAIGDALLATLAGFGLATVTRSIEAWQRPLRIGGALVIIAMGIGLLLWMQRGHRLPQSPGPAAMMGRRKAFASALLLTVGNPVTLLSFLAIFAAVPLAGRTPGYGDTALLVAAVFAGSALWFALLSRCAYAVSLRHGERAARLFDAVAALLLIALGLLALVAPGA
jgi:threonine/homoserine/homoserine lactone efflux protein